MALTRPNVEAVKKCMLQPSKIRNVCILAHVDHGKTTISDSLLATNGLISKRSAGSMRYLDDRRDEQERGITMKSSTVSLYYSLNESEMVLNLIDTPGHIDFSTEVSAAIRICDGALIVVDVVEGVCVQTKEAIKQAYDEKITMILVVNKLDRLIIELEKDVKEIFQSILRVIEDSNAYIAELKKFDLDLDEDEHESEFSPEKDNVIFASAVDGWGFTLKQMAEMFLNAIPNETVNSLTEKMWNFDLYIDSNKVIQSGAIDKKKDNLFIQLCLKTIHYVYFTLVLRMERQKLDTIVKKLQIAHVTREMHNNNPKVQVKAVLQGWKPLAHTIIQQIYLVIPSPDNIQDNRFHHLINSNKYSGDSQNEVEEIINDFKNLQVEKSVTYISKMFCVNRKNLSENKPKVFVPSKENRDAIIKAKLAQFNQDINIENGDLGTDTIPIDPNKLINIIDGEITNNTTEEREINENIVIGLARVFTGSIEQGQELFIIPEKQDELNEVKMVKIESLYILLGRDLTLVNKVPAGNVCGISGLDSFILRTGTLSNSPKTLPLATHYSMYPIVRNSIEPKDPRQLPKLRNALKMLMQTDSCVQVVIQETGELVLLTAGDVHLAKCLEDLKHRFGDIEVNVSEPMVSLRETIQSQRKIVDFKTPSTNVNADIPELGVTLRVIAVPLPNKIRKCIEMNHVILRYVEEHQQISSIDILKRESSSKSQEKDYKNENTKAKVIRLHEQLKTAFETSRLFSKMYNNIWSISKNKDPINILLNATNYTRNIFATLDETNPRSLLDHCIINAFEMCIKSGPMCEEPIANCAFVITKFDLNDVNALDGMENKPQLVANVPIVVKNIFRFAFEKQSRRLMEPIFTTDIQVNTSILGKVYSVIGKRQGKILDAMGMDDQEKTFLVKAQIPVVNSDGFANEIRKTTSGEANPNLRFSHFEIVEGDPFYEPDSEESDEDTAAIELANRANKLMNDVRKRKGLPVDDQVVVHAEKQRTLNKKK